MGVGTVTVAMAGAAVSSSDFSSSILGTPGASEDKSFKIFLAKTVCCRDFNKKWEEKKVFLIRNSEENCKVQWASKVNMEWKTQTNFKLLLEKAAQSAMRRWAREPAKNNAGTSQPKRQLLQPSRFLKNMFLSHASLLVSCFYPQKIWRKQSMQKTISSFTSGELLHFRDCKGLSQRARNKGS